MTSESPKIPEEMSASERVAFQNYAVSILCAEDKAQLDRIESMLNRILSEERQ